VNTTTFEIILENLATLPSYRSSPPFRGSPPQFEKPWPRKYTIDITTLKIFGEEYRL
jgi:hypothetical protein